MVFNQQPAEISDDDGNASGEQESRQLLSAEFAQNQAVPSPERNVQRLEPAVLADGSQFPQDRNKLEVSATQVLDRGELRRFQQNLNAFEQRVISQGLDHAEVGKLYEQVGRLLVDNPAATIKTKERLMLAQQIMDQAARPRELDQGQHQTCSVTVVETRLYTRIPSAAAKVVADIATNGNFVTADGTTITLTAKTLEADDEARDKNTPDRNRSYASQIFQATAVNVHWMRSTVSPTGESVPKGSIRYEQHNNLRNRNDRGERLFDYSKNPPREVGTQPRLGVSHLRDISNQISGLNENGFVIEHERRSGPFTETIRSETELKDAIVEAQRDGKFPVAVRVHTGNSPFATSVIDRGVWHAVTIVDIDHAKGRVLIDNQWGRQGDKWITFGTLYRSTLQPGDKADLLPPFIIGKREPAILHTRD